MGLKGIDSSTMTPVNLLSDGKSAAEHIKGVVKV